MPSSTKRIFALNESGQSTLSFSWQNYDGAQAIYLTDSASLNNITITLTNNTEGTVGFPGGPIYSMEGSGSAGVIFLQFLDQYIPAADVAVMSWDGPTDGVTWSAATFKDSNGQYLAIAPESDVYISSGSSVTFTLTNVMTPDVSSPVTGGKVAFTYEEVTGLQQSYGAIQLPVPLLNPPNNANQNLDPLVGFAETDLVFIGTEPNSLTLYITNTQSTSITLNNPPTAPVFSVSFAFGTGTGAITTVDNSNFSVNMAGGNANNWKVIPNTLGGNPYWQFEPLTTNVLGTGVNSTAEISIGNIITQLEPGVSSVIVAWTGIPGYNDGELAVDMIKVNPIIISSLTASPAVISNPTGPTPVAIDFEVLNSTFIAITNTGFAQQTNSADYTGNAVANITGTTTFTLIASNIYTSQQVAQSVTATVTPDLYSLLPLGTVVMWAGGINNVPAGWMLCMGQTVQTPAPAGWAAGPGVTAPASGWILPDLRDRFVVGAGGTVAPATDSQGGPDQHTHNITVNPQSFQTTTDGTHNHSMTFNTTGCMSSGDTSHYTLYYGMNNGKDLGCNNGTNSQNTSSDGSHNHSVTVGFSNVVSATQNGGINPPWYSLAFIIKIF
ncbi:hypothetical protein C7T94_04095 [Pedobacter yulinensis]|uniref:Phage tail collar domain-containing protein n=1 Tax=Pedobacter yulinensis TaxID=2126353 RepID=A0A2T3HN97_9SPHI|nr:phage tail protein [Pedobacter yulinensis]PST83932.1 hypothetical protein C7T94_04095 [Pedobacter yulinensis]